MRWMILCLLASGAMAEPVESYQWRFFTDQVMGGVSTGQVQIREGALHLTGVVSTANRGGFIQARAEAVRVPADAAGLALRVRGDGQRYFVHLRTAGTALPWQYYQAAFETTADWRIVQVRWSDFEPSGALLRATPRPQDIRSVALVAYGRDHEADVWLSDIAPF